MHAQNLTVAKCATLITGHVVRGTQIAYHDIVSHIRHLFQLNSGDLRTQISTRKSRDIIISHQMGCCLGIIAQLTALTGDQEPALYHQVHMPTCKEEHPTQQDSDDSIETNICNPWTLSVQPMSTSANQYYIKICKGIRTCSAKGGENPLEKSSYSKLITVHVDTNFRLQKHKMGWIFFPAKFPILRIYQRKYLTKQLSHTQSYIVSSQLETEPQVSRAVAQQTFTKVRTWPVHIGSCQLLLRSNNCHPHCCRL